VYIPAQDGEPAATERCVSISAAMEGGSVTAPVEGMRAEGMGCRVYGYMGMRVYGYMCICVYGYVGMWV
jgi:hypothetical protein